MNTPTQGRLWTLLALTLICGICLGLLLPRNDGSPAYENEAVTAMAYGDLSSADGLTASQSTGASDTVSTAMATPENLFALTVLGGDPGSAIAPETSPEAEPGFIIEVVAENKSAQPKKRVLIYHTHTYEAYTKLEGMDYQETQEWRTPDEGYNVVRVGEELAALLRGLGFEVEHDTTAFEPPELSSAYTRSLGMLERRRDAGERYDLCIDLHRDAYIATQTGANTVNVGATELARLMLLIGKGDGQTTQGFAEKPDWESNLRIAQAVTQGVNAQVAGLCKDVMVKSGRYNQHMGVGCILIEAGNNNNTLSQVLSAMPYLAEAIAQALSEADAATDAS